MHKGPPHTRMSSSTTANSIPLTAREREILVEIAHGLSNQQIAQKLYIGLPTVKTHVTHILQKTHAHDRVQAAVFAFENGLV